MSIEEKLYEINDKKIAIICNKPEYSEHIYSEYGNNPQNMNIWRFYEDETCVRMYEKRLFYGSLDYYRDYTYSSFIYYEDFIKGDYYIINDRAICMNELSQNKIESLIKTCRNYVGKIL